MSLRGLHLLWSCVFAAAALGQEANEQQHLLAAGKTAYEKQDYDTAEKMFRGVLASAPQAFVPNEFLALVLSSKGDLRGATNYFKAAVKSDPRSAIAHVNLGTNLAQLREDASAEAEFRRALEIDPGDYQANNNLGQLLVRVGKAADSLRYLEKAQQLRPGEYSNSYDLAVAELAVGKLGEAELRIRSMLEKSPRGELHGLLGMLYEKQGKYEVAVRELATAARLDPNEDSIFEYAAEFLRHGTSEPAVQTLHEGVRLFPRSWKLHVGLGLALNENGEPDRAAEELCTAVDLAPSEPRTYSFLAYLNPAPGEAMKASLLRFERYAAQQPRNAQALYYYGLYVWNDAGGADPGGKVEALLRRALELQPDFAKAHLQLGIVYSRQDKDQLAGREYRLAIAKDPSLALAHFRMGELLVRTGQSDTGRQELEIWKTLRDRQKKREEEERARLLQFVYSPVSRPDAAP